MQGSTQRVAAAERQRLAGKPRGAQALSTGALSAPPRPAQQQQQQQQQRVPPSTQQQQQQLLAPARRSAVAGPLEGPPVAEWQRLDRMPLNQLVMHLFRVKLAAAVGEEVESTGYAAIIELTRKLNRLDPRDTRARTVAILVSLFPSWLLPVFKLLISRPMPAFSAKLNAFATALTCQWLMGPCKINDVELDGGMLGVGHGVEVQRCRYLEEAGCASVCVNSCKVPTQEFFATHMGLPLTMTPNYETFSCQFAFGKTPLPEHLDPAFAAPCFGQCPSGRTLASAALLQPRALAAAGPRGRTSGVGDRPAAAAAAARSGEAAPSCHRTQAEQQQQQQQQQQQS